MSVELTKINSNCNNINLLDLNECIGDSLKKINDAYLFFSNSQIQMSDFLENAQSNILTYFSPISAKMLQTARLIDSINEIYLNAYTTVQVLSSQWNSKEFTIYHPQIIDIFEYYNNSSYYKDIIRDTVLQIYFPAESFPENQKINVYISLSQTNTFSYNYYARYVENCSPLAHSQNALSCNGCGGDNRNAACNIDGNGCRNAYSYCRNSSSRANGRYTCLGTISDTYSFNNNFEPAFYLKDQSGDMTIEYNIDNLHDVFLSRIVKLTGVIENNQWIIT